MLYVLILVSITACSKANIELGTSGNTHVKTSTSTTKQILWQADLGNGAYQNPILYADYSDPDVVAVGDDFYMTASSFNSAPGLPVLHSTDLVNWQLIGHAVDKLVPEESFSTPQHGNGIWAPNIRYHQGKVWIFYPDPDYGIYMVQSDDPKTGIWTKPLLILAGKGLIDPTPLWDDDGQSYLLHAWAKSRAGKNNILTLRKMSSDATAVSSEGVVIIDGHQLSGYRTIEGPKFYKRNDYYYVFAPAGGVPVGWQAIFRAKNIYGPYEHYTAMEQGNTLINGPHQGAWVHTSHNEDWFFHFQSKLAYGRIVHLQPMTWVDDWPVIGNDDDGDGIGNPVSIHQKPKMASTLSPLISQPTSDEFDHKSLGVQWQWNANYHDNWYSLTSRPGYLRLFAQHNFAENTRNLWQQPAVLFQKIPAANFIAEVTLALSTTADNISAGLTMFGEDYAWIGIQHDDQGQLMLGFASCHNARKGCNESFKPEVKISNAQVTIRMTMTDGGGTVFSYLDKNNRFKAIGEMFQAKRGRWVGAKIGLFARDNSKENHTKVISSTENYVDVKSIRFYPPQ